MGVFLWISKNWFDLLQTVGIVGGLLFTAYTARKENQGRKIENFIAIKQQHREIWTLPYEHSKLFRVLQTDVDLITKPISDEEELFVKLLILHLDMAHRAIKTGVLVKIEGLDKDIKGFFGAPIPQAIWRKIKRLQDQDFVKFVEASLES